MPRQIRLIQLADVAHEQTPNEILLDTQLNTELHIISENNQTIIKLPYGNKFDIIDGMIIIKDKT
ncbi:hypothetical protein [Flavobacterium algicola]|uniref:hypothetical protein n=1 Tax=Flavobacterium algicola TaxID=556529 RepID=UPI001EFE58CA|nr:hypothetical protein [Flavobacterium algicola]MCG9792494.1 hypothetical protein [Flavobacterium algicola]